MVVGFLSLLVAMAAQNSGSSPASAQVPPLIQFSNVATDAGGNSMSGPVSIMFSLFNEQRGGEPLWSETQNNVPLDATGHYSVQLGITKPNGVPAVLFTSGEARWLGVRIAEQAEQPRVLLLSVPYALKAADAATVGGLPPSAFVLASPQNGAASAFVSEPATGDTAPPPSSAVTGTGTVNFLPLWDTTSDIVSSALFQLGTGSTAKVGVNNTTPVSTLDVKGGVTVRGTLGLPAAGVATAAAGKNSEPLNLVASAFNSTSSTAANQVFQWLAEPAGNDSSTPSATLNLLFGSGTTKPTETGLRIASNGQVTFAAGQSFPGGAGTVTNVATGLGLLGGPITTTGTLSIAPLVVPQLAVNNTFSGANNFTAANNTFVGLTATTLTSTGALNNNFAGPVTALQFESTGAGVNAFGVASFKGNISVPYAVSVEQSFNNAFGLESQASGVNGAAVYAVGGGVNGTGVYGATVDTTATGQLPLSPGLV